MTTATNLLTNHPLPPLPTNPTPARSRAERTDAIASALTAAANLIHHTGLPAAQVEVTVGGGGHRLDQETDTWIPSVETVSVMVPRDGTEFLDWCTELGVRRVAVRRRAGDVCLSAMVRRDGLDWRISGGIWGATALPAADVQWYPTLSGRRSPDGVCTVAGLRVAYARLGLLSAVA